MKRNARFTPLIFGCLQALLMLPSALAQSEGDLVKKLSGTDARTRRSAVKSLAQIGSEAAWKAIAEEALGDTEPQVADEAQWQMGRASWSEALMETVDSKLALRARAELVRERVAEALGRVQGTVPAELFTRALKDKEAAVRAAAAYALEARLRLGAEALDLSDAKELANLRKAASKVANSDRDERARANGIAALAALASVDPGSEALAKKALSREDRSGLVRAASLWAAGDVNTVADLSAALADEDHGAAMVALRLLHRRADRDSVVALSAALPGDGLPAGDAKMRPALAWAIVGSLREASGLSHGLARARWVRWAEGLDADWKRVADPEKGNGKREADEESASTTFYGLRLVSDRLVFLVDMSGSMWTKSGDTTRKVQVGVELAKALRGLPEHASFNLIPYATFPGPWEDGLVPATSKNVEKAIEWFERNTQRGKGDVWTALIPVLRDPEVDTVVILSDGAPSGGERWNVELMRPLLQDENRLRGVVIHAVMFDASKFLQRSWKAIVGDWGGVQQLID
ncbi:MAG: hypothetical protein ACJA0P_002642 [Planctomycetota bacterium]|jgi:hypothetical protein